MKRPTIINLEAPLERWRDSTGGMSDYLALGRSQIIPVNRGSFWKSLGANS
jgi:hypothetical protein